MVGPPPALPKLPPQLHRELAWGGGSSGGAAAADEAASHYDDDDDDGGDGSTSSSLSEGPLDDATLAALGLAAAQHVY